MKVLFAVNLVLLPLLAMGQEEDRGINSTDISERQRCYVPGQCQEYSVNFKRTDDVDLCHKFCGQNEDCSWWSFEPSQNLCLLFDNCTESGSPDIVACEECISGERLCPPRECHGAFKCQDIFIDSFEIEHLEDCLQACSDVAECMWFTLEKTHNHCILYEGCEAQLECETCATGERECSAGYHGPTEAQTTAPPTTAYPTTAYPTTAYPTTAYPTTAYPTTAYPTTQQQCSDDGCDCLHSYDCDSGFCVEDINTLEYKCSANPPCVPTNGVCFFDSDCCGIQTCLEYAPGQKKCVVA